MPTRISYPSLHGLIMNHLVAVGCGVHDANTAAGALATTDAMGVFTHGSKLLSGYLKRLRGGGYRAQGEPKVLREGPAWAIVDGDSMLGQVGGIYCIDMAIEKANSTGIAYVGLRNTGHIGAAGIYAIEAAGRGCIALVTGNDTPSVAAPGSRRAVLGSNPLAMAIPVHGGDPILLDMATAAVAGGKVYAAHQRGEAIPPTWLIGPDGLPTTDAGLYPEHAALAPMSAHKGYGLGLWCEVLSGILPGGRITWEIGSWIFDPADRPSGHNAGFILINPQVIGEPAEYDQKIAKLIAEIHAAPKADDVDEILLPGEREWRRFRHSFEHGIDLPDDVVAKLQEASKFTGVAFPSSSPAV